MLKHLHIHDEAEEKVWGKMPKDKAFEKAADTFRLISDATRLKILWLLCHHETCVNNIAIAVDMSSPAVSHHLRILKQAGLIVSRRDGKEMYYKLAGGKEAELVHKAIDDILNIKCFL